MANESDEKTWITYSIGRAYLKLELPDVGLEFACKSLEHAKESKDDVWMINANVLLAHIYGKKKSFLLGCSATTPNTCLVEHFHSRFVFGNFKEIVLKHIENIEQWCTMFSGCFLLIVRGCQTLLLYKSTFQHLSRLVVDLFGHY